MITKQGDSYLQPVRNERHAALDVFLGDWVAEGLSLGGPNQDPQKPRDNPTPWKSSLATRT